MDFSAVCRTCLKGEHLNPVFPDSEDVFPYSNAIYVTTGVQIEPNDGLPQQICSFCMDFINQSLKFRKSCRVAQIKLLKSINVDLSNSSDKSTNGSVKNFIILSENKVSSAEIKIESDEEISNLKTEYTDYEALEDEEGNQTPVKDLTKETETTCDNDEDIISNVKPYNPDDLYLLKDTSENRNKRVICKLCQKDLSIRSIDAHMDKAHPGADERKTKCEFCDSYVTKEKLARHMSMIHGIKKGQEKNFGRCGYCKTEFDSMEILIQHVANCTAKKKKRKVCESSRQLVECNVCNKKMQKGSLRLHRAMAHAGMKPVCEHCGRAFANKLRLDEHYRAKHGYDKFKCCYCDYETARIMSMENHKRKHRGEKPFICETCGAKFHAAYLLAQHRQSHRTDRPLKCDLCSASFKTSNSLQMHKKACHSPTVYKCMVCPKSYSCKYYAVKHMRRAHRFSGPVPDLSNVPDTQDVDTVQN